jgi:tagaturonate reductase
VLPSILEYKKRFGSYPQTLIFAFAKLLAFYKTDMTNDDPAVTEFMKTKSVSEILANTAFWGEDLSALVPEVEKYVD